MCAALDQVPSTCQEGPKPSLCSLKHDEAVGRKGDHSVTLKLGKAHPIYVCGFLVSSQDIKKIQFTYLRHHIANRFKEFNWQTSGWSSIYSEITGDILLQGKNKPPLEALKHLCDCPGHQGRRGWDTTVLPRKPRETKLTPSFQRSLSQT